MTTDKCDPDQGPSGTNGEIKERKGIRIEGRSERGETV
jgi:hypothetical protein